MAESPGDIDINILPQHRGEVSLSRFTGPEFLGLGWHWREIYLYLARVISTSRYSIRFIMRV